jgi:hypothetical protein
MGFDAGSALMTLNIYTSVSPLKQFQETHLDFYFWFSENELVSL